MGHLYEGTKNQDTTRLIDYILLTLKPQYRFANSFYGCKIYAWELWKIDHSPQKKEKR